MESKKRGETETESEHYSPRSKEKGPLLGASSELGKNSFLKTGETWGASWLIWLNV